MCKFKSGIVTKRGVTLAPTYNDSHSDLLRMIGIEDNEINMMKVFVRAELVPPNDNRAIDVKEWKYIVDQDYVPDWYEEDAKRYEKEFRAAVEEWVKKNTVVIAGKSCLPIKEDENGIYYFLNGTLGISEFGNNNNFSESKVREELNNSDFARELKNLYGDRLVPITSDLTSLDGLKDYGKAEGDILAPLTLDLYRECREKITNTGWYWLATPCSTPNGYGSDLVCYVCGSGAVSYGWCDGHRSVRPFFILKSSNL